MKHGVISETVELVSDDWYRAMARKECCQLDGVEPETSSMATHSSMGRRLKLMARGRMLLGSSHEQELDPLSCGIIH